MKLNRLFEDVSGAVGVDCVATTPSSLFGGTPSILGTKLKRKIKVAKSPVFQKNKTRMVKRKI